MGSLVMRNSVQGGSLITAVAAGFLAFHFLPLIAVFAVYALLGAAVISVFKAVSEPSSYSYSSSSPYSYSSSTGYNPYSRSDLGSTSPFVSASQTYTSRDKSGAFESSTRSYRSDDFGRTGYKSEFRNEPSSRSSYPGFHKPAPSAYPAYQPPHYGSGMSSYDDPGARAYEDTSSSNNDLAMACAVGAGALLAYSMS